MKLLALLLSVFLPGLGQVWLSRYRRGIALFFSVVILLDLALVIIPFSVPSLSAIIFILWAFAVIIYIYNLNDIIWVVFLRERRSLAEKKKPLFQEGVKFYLANNLDNAAESFRQVLKLDRDDIDVMFYLALVYKNMGKHGNGRRMFNKCSNLDLNNKWKQQIQAEMV
ncbi:MAG: hypothetical protein HY762_04655 [Planctomycetes bacterium]|nr:hypothetical protein [Planctomycetota bacterium]